MPTQDCPLCKHESIPYQGADYGRSKVFNCHKCKVFVLPTATEQLVLGAPKEWLDALSTQSSSVPAGSLLLIAYNDQTKEIDRIVKPEGSWL